MRARKLLTIVAAATAAACAAPAAASADVVWLCAPELADDPCEIATDTTVRELDGTERVEAPPRAPQAERPVDCFYVYPTVSNQPTPNASKSRDPELVSIAKYQAARFSTICRMFAPIYRQQTVAGLTAGGLTGGGDPAVREIAYADVAEAWHAYLAQHNRGRGVVLIGHSQGTRMLRALIRREIDADPAQRRLLVGGMLLGGNVTVARGRTAGGDWRNVPVCTEPHQPGCVVAFSTYSKDPPPDSRYGELDPQERDPLGLPTGPEYEVACTDPGPLSGMTGPFGVTIPSEPFAPGAIAALILGTYNGAPPSAPTTWVTPRDRFQGGCRTIGGANVLRYDPVGDSRRPSHRPTDDWGTHIIDVNLGLERQVAIVARQTAAWLGREQGAAPRRCASRRAFGIRVPRRMRGRRVTGARVVVNGKRVPVRRRAGRLRARVDLRGLPRGRYAVRIVARLRGGGTARQTRRYRTCAPRRPG